MSRIPAASEVMVDNERVRVTQWRLPPNGGETGWHEHALDYVITPITGGALTIEAPDGEITQFPLAPGQSYFRHAGVKHNVMNHGAADVVFVEVETK